MTGETKITLSTKELELVNNTEWILTKHRILDKVYTLFGIAASYLKSLAEGRSVQFPEVWDKNAKISRGENYRQLPYVILDYPRHFSRDASFAIRTFFWWGNFISVNLQLAGPFKQAAISALKAHFQYLQQHEYWICIGDDPWQHHFEPDNFTPIKNLSVSAFAEIVDSKAFVKIAKKLHLEQWDAASQFIEQSFSEIIMMLETNYPGGEKGLSPGIPKVGFDL